MRARRLFAAWLFLAAAAHAAHGQEAAGRFAGRPITQVTVLVEQQPADDPSLAELVETRVGQPLSLVDVRETISHVYSLGRFQDVQVEAIPEAAGVALRYNLIPVRLVERVELEGDLGLSRGTIRDLLNDRFGRAPQIARASEAVRQLERLYQDHGYYNASIRPEVVDRGDSTILTFHVQAGVQARVQSIQIVGVPPAQHAPILRRLDLREGQAYERVVLQQRLTEYVQQLKRRGHLQAAARHVPTISDDGAAADIRLDVEPGPIVSVVFRGDEIPAAQRETLVPFEREGSIDEDLIEDAVQQIREYLQQQGYWRGEVAVDPQRDGDRLTVVFTIRKGPLYRVAPEGVQITGNKAIAADQLRPLVVQTPGMPYVAAHLDASAAAIRALYRSRGFAWAEIETSESVATQAGDPFAGLVRPTIAIEEGPQATIGDVAVTGATALGDAEIRRLMRLQPGTPYYEPTLRAARDAVQLEYLNLGFASAEVALTPALSEDRSRVGISLAIVEGPQTLVDHVIVVGNQRTSEDVIRRELVLRPGAPLGLRDLLESRRRLSALGLFRRIDIRELEHGPATRRDVLVTVEEAPATTVGYGGGVEFTRRLRAGGPAGEAEERIELAPRGFFDIGRRNLGGKNRAVNLFTRVSVRPQDAPDDPERDGRGLGFSEYRIVGTFREPRPLGWNADFTVTGAVEQGVRSSFNFARKGVTMELMRRLTTATRTTVRYSFGTTRTFDERLALDEQAVIDRIFPQVRLSVVSAAVVVDRRDDVVEPTTGTFLSVENSMASRFTGGQVGFLKTFMQGYWFTPLPAGIVFATRASVGLADGFPREAQPTDEDGRPIEGTPEIIEDLPASERFFAGGDTTIRGYALDTVGAPNTISERGFPRGGNAVLIVNGELRVPVWKDLGAAVFVDGGNVFERVTQFDFGGLKGSVGFGVRYRSPIGPVRLDLGFKMERESFGDRPVLHFSIGQAF